MQKYRNRLLGGLAIVFLIYVTLLLLTNTGELLPYLRAYPWALLLPVAMLKASAWLLRFLRWHYYLGVIKAADKISLLDSAVIFVSGFVLVISPGKLAELLKAVVLKVKTGVPVARSAPVVIAERAVDGIAVLIASALAFFLAGSAIELGDYRYLVFLSAGLLAFGLVAVQIRPLAYFVLNLIHRVPLVGRLYHPLATFYESGREIMHLRHVLPTTGLSTLAHLADALSFCLILSGFGLEITWTLYLQAVFITGLTAAVGALSGVPNGAGITEVTSSGMMLAILAPGNPAITPTVALTAALIEGFSHKWLRVFVGMMTALIFRQRLFSPALASALEEVEADERGVRAVESEGLAA